METDKAGGKSFEPVSSKVDFVALEKKWLEKWEKSGLLNKYLHKNDSSAKKFSFLDGPITANGLMGVHHAWGRTLKDLYRRYKNMRGYKQRFENGFDCQGLWVEVEVEKQLGFNSKKDIVNFGLDKFTLACKDRVNKYSKIQTDQSIRLGYFMDWDNSYYTMSETNNLYIWRFLKLCQEKGLIYKGKSAATWCPRCGTGLSKHEQAESYKNVEDTSVYVKFSIKGKKNEYILAWTTTPWTLSANVLLAVNPKLKYVKANYNDDIYYLGETAAKKLGFEKIEPIDVQSIINVEYDSLYDIPAQKGVKHYVVDWDLVGEDDGTEVVHIAPGCGEEDFLLGQKLKVEAISPIDEAGFFIDGFGELNGKYAHKVAPLVLDYLKEKNYLFKEEKFTHSYPHCWRCGTKCLFRLENNWFINCQKIKEGLKEIASGANWIPDSVGKRMQDWLENMGDWMISRKRFYGLALPFYECKKCGQLTIVGDKKELKSLAVDPSLVDKLPSVHRPWIDEIKIKCPKCGEEVSRIADVGDVWLDAGVVPFSTLKYFEDKSYWEEWFPAELVCEMIEQVRLWYYSMLVYSYIFEGKTPYINVLSHSEVRDEKGERMSKTKHNGIPYDEAVDKMGADVMRWIYAGQNPGAYLNFGYNIGDETRRQFHLLLWNIYSFFITYANIDGWKSGADAYKSTNILDRWIMSRLNGLIEGVGDSLDRYDNSTAVRLIEDFTSDLSTWYIRRSRDRVGPSAKNAEDKNLCYGTLWEVLAFLCQVLAPFVPFLAEEMYSNLTNGESVHLSNWPTVGKIEPQIEESMAQARKVCELAHASRKLAGIKIRQPLKKIKIQNSKFKIAEEFVDLIKSELNVREVEFTDKLGGEDVQLDTNLTPELIEEGEARDMVRKIQELRKGKGYKLDQKIKTTVPKLPTKEDLLGYIKQETLSESLAEGELDIELL